MPKALVTHRKAIRRSAPLIPTLKFKGITRTRTSAGRVLSKTKKKAEEYRESTPTVPPSTLPELTPTEVLGADEWEEEEEHVVEPLKGPSRAVSVSSLPQCVVGGATHSQIGQGT